MVAIDALTSAWERVSTSVHLIAPHGHGPASKPWHPIPLLLLGLSLATLAGCKPAAAKNSPPPPPEVFVAQPIEQLVVDFEEYPGRLAAAETVNIRSRVTGYLEKIHFKDGDTVKAGDILFEIDSRPYQAELDRMAAAVSQAEARLERTIRQEERVRPLAGTKAISQEEVDLAVFDRAEAEAALKAAKASHELAKLDLSYTKITAKIGGKISRRQVDSGNLIQADDTLLATILSIDPIYAYFAIDERTLLRLRRMAQEGALRYDEDSTFPVQVGLADEEDFPRHGTVTFLDNHLDPQTGTLAARADIENANGMLSPGLFVRMRTPIGEPHPAILIQEEALGSDQGQRFLYVVNDKDEVAYRRVTIGRAVKGRRVVTDGLSLGERVIVTGVQRVRPGQKVVAKPLEEVGKISSEADRGEADQPVKEREAKPSGTAESTRSASK